MWLQANAGLKRQMDGMAVQLLSVQADAAVAQQAAAGLRQQLRAEQAEWAAAVAQARAGRLELLQLQVRGRRRGGGWRVATGVGSCGADHLSPATPGRIRGRFMLAPRRRSWLHSQGPRRRCMCGRSSWGRPSKTRRPQLSMAAKQVCRGGNLLLPARPLQVLSVHAYGPAGSSGPGGHGGSTTGGAGGAAEAGSGGAVGAAASRGLEPVHSAAEGC